MNLQPLRRLTLATSQTATPDRLSAASGIVVAGEFMYAIADDELHLGVFDLGGQGLSGQGLSGQGAGRWVRIFPGDLPDAAALRKARKPDLEALLRLPPFAAYPSGALLALGSGSTPGRRGGVLLGLDGAGALSGAPRAVDLSALYAALQRDFPALNIEGAVVRGRDLVLLQRASGGHPYNALIRFPLDDALQALSVGGDLRLPALPATVSRVELGRIDGVALGFTDAAALPDGRLIFSAVAENVDDTYHDGPCVGAAIGSLDPDGRLLTLEFVRPVRKIEGIDARQDGALIRLLLVTDADDRGAAAELFSASLTF
ncbi:DUF6929 family protein [Lysobacter sp. CA199]|uniref:DUF6929 family protein n=1 Tax=Lysobacter sp. CA199 TaxID=3455608 RepID=UPI003F8D1A9A